MIKTRVAFSALGGLGEIGLNAYLYNIFDEESSEYLMVDLGMGFNDNPNLPIDTMYPDIDYVMSSGAKISGLVITHGHEDHIGAIASCWERLNCPVYATPWVADLIRSKLKEHKLDNKINLIDVNINQEYEIGQFVVKWLPVSHSIPEANLLLIKTPKGNLVHSGDFKINKDDEKIVANLQSLQKEKIKYLFCDSTNVLEKGRTSDEKSLKPDLKDIISKAKGVCWITLFSSNLDRISNIIEIAKSLNKSILLLGRSLENYTSIGIKHGIINPSVFVDEEMASKLPRTSLIYLATGGQGEHKSVLFNVIINNNYGKKLESNDCVIFSSRVIPGNEVKVNKYYNLLSLRDIEYYTDGDYHIHVSGHPKQEELKIMYGAIKPEYIVPIHGEVQHLKEHSKFAYENGYNSFSCLNGDIVELFSEEPKLIGNFTPNKKTLEGNRLVNFDEMFFKTRLKIFQNGTIFVSILRVADSILEVKISPMGLLDSLETEYYVPPITEKLLLMLQQLMTQEKLDNKDIEEETQNLVRKYFKDKIDKKPIVKVHILG